MKREDNIRNKQLKIFILLLIFIGVLGIGYATIQNINFNINGNSTASVDSDNYNVHFNKNITPTVSSDNINANIDEDDDKVAYFDVSELATIDDEATVTFNVINESNGIATLLSLEITNSNTEYFNVSKDIQKTNLLAGENTNVTITVSLGWSFKKSLICAKARAQVRGTVHASSSYA